MQVRQRRYSSAGFKSARIKMLRAAGIIPRITNVNGRYKRFNAWSRRAILMKRWGNRGKVSDSAARYRYNRTRFGQNRSPAYPPKWLRLQMAKNKQMRYRRR